MIQDPKRVEPSESGEMLEPELRDALVNFKSSVDAWSDAMMSDAMMSRPQQTVKEPAATPGWGAMKWALSCAVFIATVSGGVYQNHRLLENAKVEAARVAEQQREVAVQRAKEEEDLMAKVDSDVAREVPSALEPLASLMRDSESR
jgi:hypothetical protein